MTLNFQTGAFSKFFAILGCEHFSRLYCAEMAGDKPRQPAYEILSIEHVDFSSQSLDNLGSRRPMHTGVKVKYPSKNGYLSAVGLPSMKIVADRHRHTAYHNKHWR